MLYDETGNNQRLCYGICTLSRDIRLQLLRTIGLRCHPSATSLRDKKKSIATELNRGSDLHNLQKHIWPKKLLANFNVMVASHCLRS